MTYDLAQLRKLYASGRLKAARITPCNAGEWQLTIERADGEQVVMAVARSTRTKLYKSLEAAAEDAKRVGFGEVALKVA